jgi:predicted secreted protein
MALAGKDGKVMIGINVVASIKNWKLEAEKDMLETTSLGESWKSFIAGLGAWTASAEGDWVITTDTNGQTALQTAYLSGTSVTLKLYIDSTHYYSGTAFINKLGIEDNVEDAVSASFDFQGSGVLSYT